MLDGKTHCGSKRVIEKFEIAKAIGPKHVGAWRNVYRLGVDSGSVWREFKDKAQVVDDTLDHLARWASLEGEKMGEASRSHDIVDDVHLSIAGEIFRPIDEE